MDACTVTTLDVITAFAVPNLNCSSQSQSIFSGLAAPELPRFAITQFTSDWQRFIFANPFNRRRSSH